jgi:hypothetical protein
MITDDAAFLFLLISICLGAGFVWALWEFEQSRERRLRKAVMEKISAGSR